MVWVAFLSVGPSSFIHFPPSFLPRLSLSVCVTGVAGVVHLIGAVLSFGFFEVTPSSPSLLYSCFFHGLITWTGAGLYYMAAVVRVRRSEQSKQAVREYDHDGDDGEAMVIMMTS